MKIGSHRSLSYVHRRLTCSLLREPSSQPLLFLYPQWFQRKWRRNQHTAHAIGQDARAIKADSLKGETNHDVLHKTTWYDPVLEFKTSNSPVGKDSRYTAQQREEKYSPAGLNTAVLADALLWASDNAAELEESDVELFVISKDVLMEVAGYTEENTWIHGDGSACTISVMSEDDTSSPHRTIKLKGSPRSREIARKHLEEVQWLPAHTTSSHFPGPTTINQLDQLDRFPEPGTWNVKSFYEYVKLVTSFWSRQSMGRYLYNRTCFHQEAGEVLKSLFSRADLKHCVSTRALRQALSFCRKHTDLAGVANIVLSQVLQNGLQADLVIYNTELARLLRMNNQAEALKRIREMAELGIRPDAYTWSLVMRYIDSGLLRRRLLDEVRARGLLETPDQKEVFATIFTRKEFPQYKSQLDGVETFSQKMDNQFGDGWLTCQTIRAMLRVCVIGRSHHAVASQVLAKTQENPLAVNLDALCMMELLRICTETGNMKDALEILKSAPLREDRSHDQKIVFTTHLLARRRRFYNVSRLLWHYAASAGIIQYYDMSELVKKSLISNQKIAHGNNSSYVKWEQGFGKVTVGTNLDTTNFKQMFPYLHKLNVKPTITNWLKIYTLNDGTRNDQMMLAHLILERDRNAWRFFEPMPWDQFLFLFDEAIKLDLVWKERDLAETKPIDWLVENAIKVPLTPRTEPLIYDSDSVRKTFRVNEFQLDMGTLQLTEEEKNRHAADRAIEKHAAAEKYPEPAGRLHLPELAQIAAGVAPGRKFSSANAEAQ